MEWFSLRFFQAVYLRLISEESALGDYLRTTRECTLDEMNPVVAESIREHIQKYELEDVESSSLISCETTSTKIKKGFFGGKAEPIQTGILLTPRWLIWASANAKETFGVHSARLDTIQAQDYEKSEMFKLVSDSGVNISGLRTDSTDVGSIFIGLGPEAAAVRFRAMLKEAISKT